jgi:SAM-dependent methyltransferase
VNRTAHAQPKLATPAGRGLAPPANSEQVSSAEGYARWAPLYDTSLNPLLAREERYLFPLLTNLHRRQILDVACGTGRWIENLLSRGATSAVGFDCSGAMLRVAREKQKLTGRLARATCESLPFRAATFDLAICSFALGHVEELESMARELARVMRAGADAFVSDLHPEAYARGWRVGFRDKSAAVQIEATPRSVEEMNSTFLMNGFECQACESLWLGDPESALFERSGKSHSFAEACQTPAVLVCLFKRAGSPRGGRSVHLAETKS